MSVVSYLKEQIRKNQTPTKSFSLSALNSV